MRYEILLGIAAGLLAAVGLFVLGRALLRRMVDKRISAFQRSLTETHYAEVQNIYRQMRAWRHDYHNHLQTLMAYLAMDQKEEAQAYLSALEQDLTQVDTVVKTGNLMLDAILNSKLSLASQRGVRVNATAHVPEKLHVSDVDLCSILGNLMDNAMEAACLLPEEARWMRVYIAPLKQQLYLSVSNAMEGAARKQGRRFLSRKGRGHGLGLARIDALANKYGGYVNRQSEEGVFATEVLLPL